MSMEHEIQVVVAGGDLRQVSAASRLQREGFLVHTLCLELAPKLVEPLREADEEALGRADVVLLPIPATVDGKLVHTPCSERELCLETVFRLARPESLLLGGLLSPAFQEQAARWGHRPVDYLKREELAVRNAAATAEGAVAIAIEELPITLYGCRCLITGFGRIGRRLAQVLTGLGAQVTVAARKPGDRAWAELTGCKTVEIGRLEHEISQMELVFNTVPALVLDRPVLARLKPDCLVIDLASKPGGAGVPQDNKAFLRPA